LEDHLSPEMGVDLQLVSPFPAHAIPWAWVWTTEFRHRVADDFAPTTIDGFVEHWERADRAGRKTWAVIRKGEIGGVIMAQKISPVVSDIHATFAKRFWGHETTLRAVRGVAGQLFAEGVIKLMTIAFADNHAVRGLWRSLGGSVEGRLVSHTIRGGKVVDAVILGLPKEDLKRDS